MMARTEIVQEDINALKAGGMMKQKEPHLFSIRLRVIGGYMNAEQLSALDKLSKKYGRGYVHLTTRQGVEIPYVQFKDIEALRAELAEVGLEFGACGPRVRTITACQGAACSHGLIDPQTLARKIDDRVFGRSGLPHKFKIAITGCANACIKPLENDLGIQGIARKVFREDLCTHCGLCVHACPVADTLKIEDERLVYRDETCVDCGACIAACPNDAWERIGTGYILYVGGKMGKRPRLGDRLPIEITDDEKLLEAVDKTIDWYAVNGEAGERFGDTLDRVGSETLVAELAAL